MVKKETLMPEGYTVKNDKSLEGYLKFATKLYEEKKYVTFNYTLGKPRSPKQQSALEVYFKEAAKKLNDAGIYHKMNSQFIKGDIEIPWTQESFKLFWKQIQNTMYGIESTTEIHSDKVAKVYDAINRGLVERTGIHIPFPSKDMTD
jgi:hypothetical protein